jgi:ankyrin repeat protein
MGRFMEFIENDPPVSTDDGKAFVSASKNYDFNTVRDLLTKGVDANWKHFEIDGGCATLQNSARLGNSIILDVLLQQYCIDVIIRDNYGWAPLHHAAFHAKEEVVRKLFSHQGVQIDAESTAGETPLQLAENAGHKAIVTILRVAAKSTTQSGPSGCLGTPQQATWSPTAAGVFGD